MELETASQTVRGSTAIHGMDRHRAFAPLRSRSRLGGCLRWTVDLRWKASSSEPYAYILTIWIAPVDGNRMVFGGGVQGGAGAMLFMSEDGGRSPTRISLEGAPDGSVRALAPSPDGQQLLAFVETAAGVIAHVIGL
jgi:hypothetical protein